jgi:NADH-quinone oxidoreductase subunit D
MNSNHAYALVSKSSATSKSLRAELMRVMVAELNRISSHMICVGALAMDMGAYTPFLHGICHRERVNDIFEEVCGARLTYNYMTIGGVAYDAPPGFIDKCDQFADYLWPKMVEFNELITSNTIFQERLCNVGICRAKGHQLGPVGRTCAARACIGIRKNEPYSIYDKLNSTSCRATAATRTAATRSARLETATTATSSREGSLRISRSSSSSAR